MTAPLDLAEGRALLSKAAQRDATAQDLYEWREWARNNAAALLDECERLRKDARRYEWAREQSWALDPLRLAPVRPDKFDALVDAAAARQEGK